MTDPIPRFITFVIALAVVATIVAGVLVVASASPTKNTAAPPQNAPQVQQQPDQVQDGANGCSRECAVKQLKCEKGCPEAKGEPRTQCARACRDEYNTCVKTCSG